MPVAPEIRAELKLHPDVQSLEDEWSGVTDPVIRRKLQNRLNQRAARRRKAAQKNAAEVATSSSSSSQVTGLRSIPLRQRVDLNDLVTLKNQKITSSQWHAAAESFSQSNKSTFISIRSKRSCQRWYEVLLENRLVEIRDLAARLQNERDNAWLYPLPGDHLISLVYYNVYRALIANTEMLGLDLNLMYTDDYPSPFLPLSQTANSNIRRLPPALQPTELQRTIAHHPQWDIIPDPDVRDNILRYGEENIDDLQLCLDMIGDGAYHDTGDLDVQEKNGLIIWGEPWEIDGWEVTETFARKWPFMIRGAMAVQNSTNKWRTKRGEEPLNFSRILEVE
ncbi:uncharacterized protein Z518_04181 [Rhinocladiella mackenziei CBS 650.93]|uniref:BZIP domain-containing protein n=1 Tax=Rhinocladiella mackenziei CBS 650.93 TaxID=1442369 RepID=A0A0D2ISR0_9EURO|nr:uncharacterized protein Z518_04181 [Rhinocladiella mackenziei CBS 650.93]KIX06206.1 hypothetical protein Z518_04181 [Rhinocladiella mackenziei CBS 650.93]